MKRCSRCGEVKGLGEFHRDKSKRDGHRCICRVCVNSCYARIRRQPVIHWVRDHTGVYRAVDVYDPEPDVSPQTQETA